jgi:hypothetical protein
MPARICHSTVARMLGEVSKAESSSHSSQNNVTGLNASDAVQEQLSPFDNLALDAETKACSLSLFPLLLSLTCLPFLLLLSLSLSCAQANHALSEVLFG